MFGTTVYHKGEKVMHSRNLRAMRDYARVSPVATVECHPSVSNPFNGQLNLAYANGAQCGAFFRDYSVLLEWLCARRTWRSAQWQVAPPLPVFATGRAAPAFAKLQKLGLAS